MSADTAPWPRLLACWRDGRLRTLLLHADGRRTHAGNEAIGDGAQLAPALADALATLHRNVHHAVLRGDEPADDGQQGGLAHAGRTGHGHHLAGADLEALNHYLSTRGPVSPPPADRISVR